MDRTWPLILALLVLWAGGAAAQASLDARGDTTAPSRRFWLSYDGRDGPERYLEWLWKDAVNLYTRPLFWRGDEWERFALGAAGVSFRPMGPGRGDMVLNGVNVDRLADRRGGGDTAGTDRPPVDVKRTCAALPDAAGELRAGQSQMFAYHPQQRCLRVSIDRMSRSVNVQIERHTPGAGLR